MSLAVKDTSPRFSEAGNFIRTYLIIKVADD
jgi:hypothetical protein